MVESSQHQTFMLLCQQWTLVHHGDGAEPAGHSFHLSEVDRQAYVARYLMSQAEEELGAEDYEEPAGDPYWVAVKASTFTLTSASPLPGKRYYRDTPMAPADAMGCWHATPDGPRVRQ